jgi:surfactin synthase thioesterase subunit
MPDHEPPMRHLSDAEFISEVSWRYDGIPNEVLACEESKQLFLPVLRAGITLKETCRYVLRPMSFNLHAANWIITRLLMRRSEEAKQVMVNIKKYSCAVPEKRK